MDLKRKVILSSAVATVAVVGAFGYWYFQPSQIAHRRDNQKMNLGYERQANFRLRILPVLCTALQAIDPGPHEFAVRSETNTNQVWSPVTGCVGITMRDGAVVGTFHVYGGFENEKVLPSYLDLNYTVNPKALVDKHPRLYEDNASRAALAQEIQNVSVSRTRLFGADASISPLVKHKRTVGVRVPFPNPFMTVPTYDYSADAYRRFSRSLEKLEGFIANQLRPDVFLYRQISKNNLTESLRPSSQMDYVIILADNEQVYAKFRVTVSTERRKTAVGVMWEKSSYSFDNLRYCLRKSFFDKINHKETITDSQNHLLKVSYASPDIFWLTFTEDYRFEDAFPMVRERTPKDFESVKPPQKEEPL